MPFGRSLFKCNISKRVMEIHSARPPLNYQKEQKILTCKKFSLKRKAKQKLPATISIFFSSRKQSHVRSDHGTIT